MIQVMSSTMGEYTVCWASYLAVGKFVARAGTLKIVPPAIMDSSLSLLTIQPNVPQHLIVYFKTGEIKQYKVEICFDQVFLHVTLMQSTLCS